jgi:succinyl-diaminopimelate desuccinylase
VSTVEIDALGLAQALIRCPSVTPKDEGVLDVLTGALEGLGFVCHRLTFSQDGAADVSNLYARFGAAAPNFCFAGHVDVVPVGDAGAWCVDPFAADVRGGHLYGRGAADMKGAIACFAAAAARFLASAPDLAGSISLLITGDEEGPAINGTAKVLRWMAERGERIDCCLVGEPTNPTRLGETIKIGRRGSLNGRLAVHGVQGHSAYPELADNPIPRLIAMLHALTAEPLDGGSDHFEASTLAITTVDVGNPARNVIPATARAAFNVRFNDHHTAAAVESWLRRRLDALGGAYDLEVAVSGESFLTPPGRLSGIVAAAIVAHVGTPPTLGTGGGTSDARFIKDVCPVAEFGLVGSTMHKVDERVALSDLDALTDIYADVLGRYFEAA